MSGERPTIAKLEQQKRILGFLNGLTLSKELGIGSVVDSRNISRTGADDMARTKTKVASGEAKSQNPKLEPNPPTNTEKEPDEWVSRDDLTSSSSPGHGLNRYGFDDQSVPA
jgi:hypothetical protein